MFRGGGKVSSYGNGIATGLADGGMPDKRGLVDGPGGYAGELFEAQPEWVKSIEGPGYLPGGGTTGHELYTRFLDKRFNPTISDPGRHRS